MSTDGDGRRTVQTPWSPATPGGLCLRLSAPSWPGPAESAWLKETPEKRRQEQERQGNRAGGDVHPEARRGRQTAWTDQQEGVGVVRGPQGGGRLGAGGSDQARLRTGHDPDGAVGHGRGPGLAAKPGTA